MVGMRPEFEVGADISRQRGSQRVRIICIQRLPISRDPTVEHAGKLLHALRDALVADTEFAQRMIDILEKLVGDFLCQIGKRLVFSPHPMQGKENMQRKHFIAAKRRIRHLKLCIKPFCRAAATITS